MCSLILHLSVGFLNPAWASKLIRPCRCTVGTEACFLACQPATYWWEKAGWALEAEPGLCLPTKWISGIPVWIIRALSPGVHIVVGCVIRGQSLHFVLCSEKNTLSLIWNPRCATQISVSGKWGCGHTHRTHASIEAKRKGEKMGKSQEEEHWAFGKCQEKCES